MSATPNINPLKIQGNKLDATAAPTAGDDINDGYNVGSVWINVSLNKGYICTQSTAGIAIWKEIGAGGSDTTIANANLTFDANHYANLNGNTWTLGGTAVIGSEKISLQKDTLIKGSDTSSITSGFKVTNSANAVLLDVTNDGGVSSISTSTVPSFTARGDGSSVDGYIKLNCWNNNHGIKLKAPPHSAYASYTLTFPDNTGTSGQVLKTDGNGLLSWGASTSNDTDAIHDNVPSEISAIAAKTTLVNNDILLIEDSADNNSKKKTTISNIKTAVASAGTPGVAQSIHSFELANTTAQATVANQMFSVKIIPTVLREVTQMSFFVILAAAQNVTLSIHDSSGTLITGAYGSTDASVLGVRTVTLNSAATLLANNEYYFSIWAASGAASANFASKPLYSNAGLGRENQSYASATPPNTLATGSTNKCFWINAF